MSTTPQTPPDFGPAAEVLFPDRQGSWVLVCEHASNHIPDHFGGLGLDPSVLFSHVAWDPGALAVSQHLSRTLKAPLVAGKVSRLVYDCNRSPEARDAMPAVSEIYDIPGNANLSAAARRERIDHVYEPFRQTLSATLAQAPQVRALLTVHSFTPVYRGAARQVEIGILHGRDAQLAQAMYAEALADDIDDVIRLNEPYAAKDGVAHTLDLHGADNGLLNVMIEIRNDLITDPDAQQAYAQKLARWAEGALARLSREAAE